MTLTVYVRLLDEGTSVFRPVPSCKITDGVCLIGGEDIYDNEIETWEFPPGTEVRYELRNLDGETVFVAFETLQPNSNEEG